MAHQCDRANRFRHMVLRILPSNILGLVQIDAGVGRDFDGDLGIVMSASFGFIVSDLDRVDEKGTDVLRAQTADDGQAFFHSLPADELGKEGVLDDEAGKMAERSIMKSKQD